MRSLPFGLRAVMVGISQVRCANVPVRDTGGGRGKRGVGRCSLVCKVAELVPGLTAMRTTSSKREAGRGVRLAPVSSGSACLPFTCAACRSRRSAEPGKCGVEGHSCVVAMSRQCNTDASPWALFGRTAVGQGGVWRTDSESSGVFAACMPCVQSVRTDRGVARRVLGDPDTRGDTKTTTCHSRSSIVKTKFFWMERVESLQSNISFQT